MAKGSDPPEHGVVIGQAAGQKSIGGRSLLRRLIIFEIAYYVAYRYGMAFSGDYPAPLWFPDSVLLCALLGSPRRTWWMYILATLPIRLLVMVPAGVPSWFLIVCLVNDSVKGLVAAVLLGGGKEQAARFDSLRGFGRYFVVAVVLAPALSAVGGAAARAPLGSEFSTAWTQWFLGNALASLTLTPALCCLVWEFPSRMATWKRRGEALLLTSCLTIASYVAFDSEWGGLEEPLLFFVLYLPVPFLLWAAVRFGPLATTGLLSLISVLAMFGAISGRGPFASPLPESAVLSIQLFLFVPSIPFLLLSVLTEQQRKTRAALGESEQRFNSLANTAPVMVWMSEPNGLCTFFNQPWLDFTGRPLEEELGDGWANGVHAEDRESAVEAYRSALHARRNFTLEYRLRRHDGVYRWVLDNGIPRYSPEGHFLGYLGGCIDITARREAEDKFGRLSRELINAQESESQRISRELHDNLGQRMVALSLGIHQLAQQMPGNEQLNLHCTHLQQDASAIISDIARLSHDLQPVVLHSLGLSAALRALCDKATNANGVIVRFSEHGPHPRKAPSTSSIALYRVAQEALRNGLTHSGADRIDIRLVTTEAAVTVVIADNGCGFDPESAGSAGFGLCGMAERMKGGGGVFSIVSNPGAGTTITASAPVADSAKAAYHSVVNPQCLP